MIVTCALLSSFFFLLIFLRFVDVSLARAGSLLVLSPPLLLDLSPPPVYDPVKSATLLPLDSSESLFTSHTPRLSLHFSPLNDSDKLVISPLDCVRWQHFIALPFSGLMFFPFAVPPAV